MWRSLPWAIPAAMLALPLAAASADEARFAEAPFTFEAAPGRLPKNVVPLAYAITLAPDAATLSLNGSESIQLQFRAATGRVQFNSNEQTLQDVRLDGKPVAGVVSDDAQQLTTVTLAAPAAVGTHTLSFSFRGKIATQPHGLFAQHYADADGKPGLLLSTQLESTDARRVFPCWDEPAFRATYQLTAIVPARWRAVSNMPIDRRTVKGSLATVRFTRTPKMPSYLVEFSAGDLAEITAVKGDVSFGLWAIRGREQDGGTALANAQLILGDYDEYFGYSYPLPKLDSIAVPGGFSGAMENWGAITYNDSLLLLNASSTLGDRQQAFSVQAHEIAHQWNGDLVTMGWWDDIWLNESFASWRAAKETDLRNPSWKWWEDQDGDKEEAMRADARISSHAIQQHVSDELQVSNAFDPEITYSKGQAVLRMFEAYLGPDVFRDGVRRYIKARAFSNATSADLWNALSAASGTNVAAVAADWTQQAGFPLVSVTAHCDASGARTLSLMQARFLLRGTAPEAVRWQIPLQVRSGVAGTARSVLFSEEAQTVAGGSCDEPLSVNANAIGFYRTQYDPATLAINTRQFGALQDADRIALLDDQWALVESNASPLKSYLVLASAMGSDLDIRAWQQIVSALGTLEHDERGTPGYGAYTAYARSLIKPVADRLGWDAKADESPNVQKLRRAALRDLGRWGDLQILAEARRRFDVFVKDHASLSPDDQELVLPLVARDADAATFDTLHALAKSARDPADVQRYYSALMAVRDDALAEQAAQIALSQELPPQMAMARPELVFVLDDQHPQLSWSTFSDNVDALMAPFPTFAPLVIAQYVPRGYWDTVPLPQLEAWVRAHVPAEMSENVARGMDSARFLRSEKDFLVPEVDAYVRSLPQSH